MQCWRALRDRLGETAFYLLLLLATWCGVQSLTRLAQLLNVAGTASWLPLDLVRSLGLGVLYDVSAGVFFCLLPLLYLLVPQHFLSARAHRMGLAALTFLLNVFMVFCAIALYLYWAEFHTNFSFIAVDYLVYTHEMIGTIFQSFHMGLIIPAILVLAGLITWGQSRFLPRDYTFAPRCALALLAAAIVFPVGVVTLTSASWHTHLTANRYNNELAGNGPYEFVHAYFANELDYDTFYATGDKRASLTELRAELAAPNVTFLDDDSTRRAIHNENALTGKRPNVVVITVESLSASYCGAFGAQETQTPYLDALTQDAFFFNNMYATGTRTVRGWALLSPRRSRMRLMCTATVAVSPSASSPQRRSNSVSRENTRPAFSMRNANSSNSRCGITISCPSRNTRCSSGRSSSPWARKVCSAAFPLPLSC